MERIAKAATLKCPLCAHPNQRPTTRSRFKCKGCGEFLELNKALTKLQSHYGRKNLERSQKEAWWNKQIEAKLPHYGTREAARASVVQDYVAQKTGVAPTVLVKPEPLFPPYQPPVLLRSAASDSSAPWD